MAKATIKVTATTTNRACKKRLSKNPAKVTFRYVRRAKKLVVDHHSPGRKQDRRLIDADLVEPQAAVGHWGEIAHPSVGPENFFRIVKRQFQRMVGDIFGNGP